MLTAESFNEAVINQGQALTGTLRLGLIPTVAPYLVPVIVEGLGRDLPRLTPELRELVTNDILDQLNQGHLDAAVISTDVPLQRVASVEMYDEPLVVLVPA